LALSIAARISARRGDEVVAPLAHRLAGGEKMLGAARDVAGGGLRRAVAVSGAV
jgi:hypothetical protein